VKFQARNNACGPAAIQNACRSLGQRVGQRRLARLCGTSCDGTAVVGLLGDGGEWRAILVDSAPNAYNRAENGVHVVAARRLLRRWRARRRTAGGEPPFYAVAMQPPPSGEDHSTSWICSIEPGAA
jgi:hypothetical protein